MVDDGQEMRKRRLSVRVSLAKSRGPAVGAFFRSPFESHSWTVHAFRARGQQGISHQSCLEFGWIDIDDAARFGRSRPAGQPDKGREPSESRKRSVQLFFVGFDHIGSSRLPVGDRAQLKRMTKDDCLRGRTCAHGTRAIFGAPGRWDDFLPCSRWYLVASLA
jgi:hypothetical protein